MPYFTVAEYVAKFGQREAILLTNTETAQAGNAATFDEVKIESALSDQSEVVDSYIGKRYATPLAAPPTIVKGWVATLAREALSVATGRVSEAVQDAADRVRAQLRDLSKGDLSLPIAEGAPAPAAADTGVASSSGDRAAPVFTAGALDGFTSTFTGGGYAPCWRQGR
jgi:phage gp36-like protein